MVTNRAIQNFDANLGAIEQLVHFDDLLIDLVLPPLERHRERLISADVTRSNLLPDPLISVLRNIKRSESLKAHYQALYNQWLVLLVSYFGSAVRDLFVDSAAAVIREQRDGQFSENLSKRQSRSWPRNTKTLVHFSRTCWRRRKVCPSRTCRALAEPSDNTSKQNCRATIS